MSKILQEDGGAANPEIGSWPLVEMGRQVEILRDADLMSRRAPTETGSFQWIRFHPQWAEFLELHAKILRPQRPIQFLACNKGLWEWPDSDDRAGQLRLCRRVHEQVRKFLLPTLPEVRMEAADVDQPTFELHYHWTVPSWMFGVL